MLAKSEEVYALARDHVDSRWVLFLGRHAGYPVALEGALKLKEIAYLHAEGFAAGELKHGPIASSRRACPPASCRPGRDQLHDKMISGIQEVRARGARTLCLAEEGDTTITPYADVLITLPQCWCCSSRSSPWCRCSCSRASSPPSSATTSTSPATSPSPSRSSRPTPCPSSASASTWSTSTALGAVPRAHAVAAGAAVHRRRSASRPGLPACAASPPRRRSPRRSARPSGMRVARRRDRLGGDRSAGLRDPRHRRRPRRGIGVATSISLSHDAGIASAVVVLESEPCCAPTSSRTDAARRRQRWPACPTAP